MFTMLNHEGTVIGGAEELDALTNSVSLVAREQGVVAWICRDGVPIIECGYPLKHVSKGDTFTFSLAAVSV
jgi:hypothetical protein